MPLRIVGDGWLRIDCPACATYIRFLQPGATLTVAELTEIENQHAATHQDPIDYQALYDGFYENGLG